MASKKKPTPIAKPKHRARETKSKPTAPGHIEWYRRKGKYHFRVVARNGRIVTSSEANGYNNKGNLFKGIEANIKISAWPKVEIREVKEEL